MSDDEDDLYSGEESSVYSYHDLAIYQYSDAEEEQAPKKNTVPTADDEVWENWNDYDNESDVMHAQSDDDYELYQFSDEDLIPEEPHEEWIVAALLANRRDFDHLELILGEVEDFGRLMHAIQMNRILKSVTIYEEFFDAIPSKEEKTMLAEMICGIPNLEQLKVYHCSSYFVAPLKRIRPPMLKTLCLMFFPNRVTKETLDTFARYLKDDDVSDNPSILESLSLRCEVMDDEFIDAISQVMAINSTVTTLSFWGNKVEVTERGALGSAQIDFYLRLNQTKIRDLHLLVNATPAHFLNKIVEEREGLDLVFYLLQTNPSFLSYSCL